MVFVRALTAVILSKHSTPNITLNESGHFFSDPSRVPRALRLSKLAVPLTCGVFDGAVMVDPTDEEERVASVVTVVRDAITNEICTVVKSGGAPVLAPAVLAVCFELASQHAKQLRAVLCAADDANGNPSWKNNRAFLYILSSFFCSIGGSGGGVGGGAKFPSSALPRQKRLIAEPGNFSCFGAGHYECVIYQ